MPNIIYEYTTDTGEHIRISSEEQQRSYSNTRGGNERSSEGDVVKKLNTKFEDALGVVKAAATSLKNVMKEVNPDEVEVEFSIKAEGEAGLFSICRAATGAEFKITLKWKNEK